jgi:hypothetical protein
MFKTGFITALLAGAGILAQSDLNLGETGGIVAPNYIISAKPPQNVSLSINTYDVEKRNVTARSLYGIMHEDISHSGDGGIYAELLINRAFQGGPGACPFLIRDVDLKVPKSTPTTIPSSHTKRL